MRHRPIGPRKFTVAAASLLGAVALTALVGLLPAQGAPGMSVTETGWWSRNPAATAPAGGFQVGTAPDGPVSTSAVRLAIEGRIDKATIILGESGGVPSAAALRACVTTGSWSATTHEWAKAPAADCTKNVALTRNATAATWTADITALVPPGATTLSVMIVPATGGAPAWQVDFGLAIVSAEARPEPTTTTTTTMAASSGPSGGSSAGFDNSGSSSTPASSAGTTFAGGSFVSDITTDAAADLALEPDPGTVPDAAAASPSDPAALGFTPAVAAPGQSAPWDRLLLFLPVAAIAGAAIAAGRRRWLDRVVA